MNKKVKIGLAVGTTLALSVIGYLVYRRVEQRNATARKYLEDVDDNGGNPPQSEPNTQSQGRPFLAPSKKVFTKKNLTLASRDVAVKQLATNVV
jgi:hypothetical protein